jgi:hypothetical protein
MAYLVQLGHQTELRHDSSSIRDLDSQLLLFVVPNFTKFKTNPVQTNRRKTLVFILVQLVHQLLVDGFALLLYNVLDGEA